MTYRVFGCNKINVGGKKKRRKERASRGAKEGGISEPIPNGRLGGPRDLQGTAEKKKK